MFEMSRGSNAFHYLSSVGAVGTPHAFVVWSGAHWDVLSLNASARDLVLEVVSLYAVSHFLT